MSRRLSALVILCVLAALSGCGSGDDDSADTTTTTTTAAAAAPKLSAAQSRRAAGQLLDRWSAQILAAVRKVQERQAAADKAVRDAYYKADGELRRMLAKIDEFPAQARRASARWVPQSLATAVLASGDAWKDWADGTADIQSAAERRLTPDVLARNALVAHLAAYEAAKHTAPANFRRAGRVLQAGG